jgi:hypothetical protein
VDRKTPPPTITPKYHPLNSKAESIVCVDVPAKIVEPETARAVTLVSDNPAFTFVQLVPLFEERNMPAGVPANRLVPEEARQLIHLASVPAARPESIGVQLVPLLVERNMPPPADPPKRFVSESARSAVTSEILPPAIQFVPEFVER